VAQSARFGSEAWNVLLWWIAAIKSPITELEVRRQKRRKKVDGSSK
jgi:hypothetical protein